MAIPVAYQSFKAAGIYRLIYDKSTVANTGSTNTMRLIVGYSDKGPFNTPVLVSSQSEFTALFGNGSKALEKRGVFFHRLAKECLSTYPCLCLNLKKFSTEHVGAVAISTKVNDTTAISQLNYLVTDIYDTTRFWTLDATRLSEINPVTVKTTGDYTYNTSGKNKTDYINISTTTTINDSCSIFIRKAVPPHVSTYDITVGTWYNDSSDEIPEYLQDKLETKISDYMAEVYVFSGKFTKEQIASSETLGQYFDIGVDNQNQVTICLKQYITNAYGEKVDTLQALYEDSTSGAVGRYIGSLIPYFKDKMGAYIDLSILFNQDVDTHHLMMDFNTDLLEGSDPVNINLAANYTPSMVRKIYSAKSSSILGNNSSPIGITTIIPSNQTVEVSSDNPNTVYDSSISNVIFEGKNNGTSISHKLSYIWVDNKTTIVLEIGDKLLPAYNTAASTYGDSFASVTEILDSDTAYNKYAIGLLGTYASYIILDSAPEYTYVKESQFKVIRVDGSFNNEIGKLSPIYFEGYEYQNDKPVSTGMKDKLNWQNYQLSAINDYKGIHTALLNKSEIDYRYIIDTFETFIDSEVKSTLSYLCKEKQSAFLITNFPSIKSFLNCPYNNYKDDKGNFNVQYVVDGYNKKKSHTTKFSLPTEANGASYCAFFTCLKSGDGYISSIVPSAGIVSNMFMTKYSTRHPYDIVAGPNYGLITGGDIDGPDYNYSKEELNIIEPFGVNCIVYRPGFGTFINANKTAKQTPVSALSSINVRELCIYLQDEIESILQGYQWEFNNASLRTKIKDKADALCQAVQNNGGLNAYENICDETNNTNEIIDNEMVVLSTSIEPGRGAGKMVQELTIYKTGGLSSSTSD